MGLKEELMEILACPICKHHPLELRVFKRSNGEIIEGIILCHKCHRWYPIIDEIPHMLPDDLREERDDKGFLERWREEIPEKILTEGKPYNLAKT